jgi:Pyruvate/2-oxoacid:ferredoxin oxidoreductase delta subunit
MKNEMTADVQPFWDSTAKAKWEDIKNALLSDPCLQRFTHRKRVYVLTDFCKDGFGYCARGCQLKLVKIFFVSDSLQNLGVCRYMLN